MTDTSRDALIKRLRTETWSGFQGMAAQAADMLEADALARVKVGDSQFESWYSEHQQAGKGSKQIAREAYEAGLNEAQQVAVPDDAIIKEIERAIVDHCTGGDLWMSASLGKDRIKRLMEAQGDTP